MGLDALGLSLRGAVGFADKDSVYVNSTFAGASPSDGVFSNYGQIGKVTGKVNAGVTFSGNESGTQVTTVDLGFRF